MPNRPDDRHDFFSIIELSKSFRDFESELLSNVHAQPSRSERIAMANAKIQLAQAQQLCNISEQLKQINERLSGGKVKP